MEKIMIVDDSKTSRRVLRTILESYEYEVAGEATTGKEAVELYKGIVARLEDGEVPLEESINLYKEGMELSKWCHDKLKTAEEQLTLIMKEDAGAKVIMVTAAAQKNKMLDAIKLGAVDFIQKPFEAEQIVSIINKTCSN